MIISVSDISLATMASDVTLELLDREEVMTMECEQDLTMDQLLVSMADICHISPVAKGLFAFKQVGALFLSGTPVHLLSQNNQTQP